MKFPLVTDATFSEQLKPKNALIAFFLNDAELGKQFSIAAATTGGAITRAH